MTVSGVGLFDSNGEEIGLGDVVRADVTGNKDEHGAWAEYVVEACGSAAVLSYLRSENGQVLPKGYTKSFLTDEYDRKRVLFGDETGCRPLRKLVVVDA